MCVVGVASGHLRLVEVRKLVRRKMIEGKQNVTRSSC
jgi:hypothetical protein